MRGGLTALIYQRHHFRVTHPALFWLNVPMEGLVMPKTTRAAFVWLGTFAGVFILVMTAFTILAAAWSSEPYFPSSIGKGACAPHPLADPSTVSCLA